MNTIEDHRKKTAEEAGIDPDSINCGGEFGSKAEGQREMERNLVLEDEARSTLKIPNH